MNPIPTLRISELTPTQREAHEWLLQHPDMIECTRGVRMRLAACLEMQKSRRHTVTMNLPDGPDEEFIRSDFIGCQECPHYDRGLSRKGHRNEGKTDRFFEIEMQREAAKEDAKAERIRQSVLLAEERKRQRKANTTKKLMAALAERKRQHKQTFEAKKRTAKHLRINMKMSVEAIAIKVKSRRETVGKWCKEFDQNRVLG